MKPPSKLSYVLTLICAVVFTVLPMESPALAAAPTLSSSSPADNSSGVDINFDLTLNFSEPMYQGTGTIYLRASSGQAVVEYWDVATTSAISGYGTSTLVLNRSVALSPNTSYFFQIDNVNFKNAANEYYFGISSSTALNFTTLAVPSCPAPTISGTARPGNDLTASVSCSNSPTSVAYQWKRGGTNIAGATNSTYTVQYDDAGYSITVTATGTNSSGTGNTGTSTGTTAYFTVERFIGTGTAGTSNGTSRLDATITDPTSLAVDSNDNVYICVANYKILKVSVDGEVSTFVGTGSSGTTDGTGTSASIAGCSDLKFGKDGFLYLNYNTNPIRRISTAGVVTTIKNASGTPINSSGLGSILVDASGNIYIARSSSGGTDSYGYLIRYNVVPCNSGVSGICHGSKTQLAYIAGAMNRAFFASNGKIIAKDSYSTYNFHITDTLDTSGSSQTFSLFAVSQSTNPNANSIALDAYDNMFWGNMVQYRLLASDFTACPSTCNGVVPKQTTVSTDFNALISGSGSNSASDSVIDSRGYLYVSQTASDVVFRIRTGVGAAPDATSPTATWTPPSSPSSSQTLSYTLAFSESVSGIATGDFSNAGTASGCAFTPSASSGTSITVSVTCSSDGTVIARLKANMVADAAGNTGPTSDADAPSVTIDTSAPTTTTTSSTTTTTSSTSSTSTTSSTTTTTVAPPPTTTTTSTTTSTSSTTSTTSTTVPIGNVGINSWTISSSQNPAAPGSRIILTTTISCGRQMRPSAAPYYPSMYYMVRSTPWINGVYGRPTLSADRRTATFTVTVTAPSAAGTYQMYAYGRDNPFGKTCTGDSYNFAVSPRFSLIVGSGEATTTTLASPTTSSNSTTTSAIVTPGVISVPVGNVGINSWTISSSQNPAAPGSRIVLTTTITCGRQMSTTAPPYYPSMYYMVRSTPWINGVYGNPTLSANRRTATFTVTVTAPSAVGTYQMYAYGRDNPFGGTCTGDSYNFANTAMFSLAVGTGTTSSSSSIILAPEASTTTSSTTTSVLVMPTITTSSTSTSTSTTSTSTTSTISVASSSTLASTQVVQLDVTTAIRLPRDATDFVVTRDSLIAIVDNLQITQGIIRVKTINGAWKELDIQNINDVVLPLDTNSSSLQIEVLEEGTTTPISYSIPITQDSGMDLWPTQILILVSAIAAMCFIVFAIRRRRDNESARAGL